MAWWGLPLFGLSMFWLAVFVGTLAESRRGGDLFEHVPTSALPNDVVRPFWQQWLASSLVLGLLLIAVPASLVLMGPPYLAGRLCLRRWLRNSGRING
jgi:hypothetical protein